MSDSQTNNLQLTLKSKKLQFKYSNNVIKEVDNCIFQGFTFKNHESHFQKNSLVHWYLKPLWNKTMLFVCEYWHIIKISGVTNSNQIIVLMMVFTSIYKAVSLREILNPGEWMKLTILCSHKFEHIFQFKNMLLWLLPARFNADLPEEFLNSYMIGNLGKHQNFWHPRGNEDVTASSIIIISKNVANFWWMTFQSTGSRHFNLFLRIKKGGLGSCPLFVVV